MIKINQEIARRFILGKQGLWPGRRWQGTDGTAQAMQEMEYLQLDPLQIIARSHDIALNSRVIDYQPGMWGDVTYKQRQFFDWGGWLAARPMDELPHWRVIMHRERDGKTHIHQMGVEHAEAVAEMRTILQERGQVSNRDFKMSKRTRTESYRGRKDSSLALYYLWRIGDVMTHHREKFERVYALTETVAPPELIRKSDEAEADRFLLMKDISFSGLERPKRTSKMKAQFNALVAEGSLVEVEVEGWKDMHYALSSDADHLDDLTAGRIPPAWTPLDTTTTEEVSFLAPLDQVSARGRGKVVFDFDYIWEVYKPVDKRLYGYYVLPILWGDQLVARFDSKLDRSTNTFIILDLWLEDAQLAQNKDFAEALARGFKRFVGFLGADKLDASAVEEPLLKKAISGMVNSKK